MSGVLCDPQLIQRYIVCRYPGRRSLSSPRRLADTSGCHSSSSLIEIRTLKFQLYFETLIQTRIVSLVYGINLFVCNFSEVIRGSSFLYVSSLFLRNILSSVELGKTQRTYFQPVIDGCDQDLRAHGRAIQGRAMESRVVRYPLFLLFLLAVGASLSSMAATFYGFESNRTGDRTI